MEDPPTSTVGSHSRGMESTLTGVSRPDLSYGSVGGIKWQRDWWDVSTSGIVECHEEFWSSLESSPSVSFSEVSLSSSKLLK